MDARAFLEALWGDMPQSNGPFIQIWSLGDRRSTYHASVAGVNVDGERDVFTAVGLTARRHGATQRAKADQICAIAGLWLDIDVGPQACHTRNDAFALASAHAQPTLTVSSGSGLHAWYLFPEPWVFRTISERERAKIIAQQWCALHQQTAAKQGMRIDSVGDLARILRVPGTLNAKDPDQPRPVIALGLDPANGPRHTYSSLARHLTHMPIMPRRELHAAPVSGDATHFDAKLDALLANSPEFAAAWEHEPAPGRIDLSASAWDMSLCSLAAGAMNDAELEALMHAHRARWNYDLTKLQRRKYIDDTLAKARSTTDRTTDRTTGLDALARRAA